MELSLLLYTFNLPPTLNHRFSYDGSGQDLGSGQANGSHLTEPLVTDSGGRTEESLIKTDQRTEEKYAAAGYTYH